jgi:Ca2+ transporting ATPase
MLWLNLIMDSLAALALASEPPSDEQLKRPPVNRSTPIITDQMVWNMLGQATYQIVVVSYLFFDPTCFPDWEDDKREDDGTRAEGPYTYHYTMIFNTFVLMQLFNQYNSRFLKGEWNILVGVHKNTLFLVTSWTTFALQVLMANFAGKFMKIHDPFGLTGRQWLMCLGLGVGPLFWQLVINCCTRAIAYFVRAWDIRGLSGLLKFGGPSNNSYRTSMPHRSSSARQNSGKISSASRIL